MNSFLNTCARFVGYPLQKLSDCCFRAHLNHTVLSSLGEKLGVSSCESKRVNEYHHVLSNAPNNHRLSITHLFKFSFSFPPFLKSASSFLSRTTSQAILQSVAGLAISRVSSGEDPISCATHENTLPSLIGDLILSSNLLVGMHTINRE